LPRRDVVVLPHAFTGKRSEAAFVYEYTVQTTYSSGLNWYTVTG
jgi:hypothetical protein